MTCSKPAIPKLQEQRYNSDRRRRPTPMISRYLFTGRRRANRRLANQPAGYYVDRPRPELVLLVIAILLLGALDIWFTYKLMQAGGKELNPMMDFCINLGWGYCATFKFLLMGTGLFILLAHQNFLKIWRFIGGVGIFYSLLIIYQIFLLSRI